MNIFLWTIIASMSKWGLQIARCFWINSLIYVLFDFYPEYFISFTFIHVRFNEYTSIKMFYYSKCPLKLVFNIHPRGKYTWWGLAYLLLYFINTSKIHFQQKIYFSHGKSNLLSVSLYLQNFVHFFHIQDNIAQNKNELW